MFKYSILISAFILAACAALFSVTGIAELFSGSVIAVGIMAGGLELSKIAATSFLYRYWNVVSKSLRTYLTIGTIAIMGITSLGIYGYLASAYATSAKDIQSMEGQIAMYNSQQNSITNNIQLLTTRKNSLESIRVQQETRLDNLLQSGRSITSQQRAIRDQNTEITSLQKQIIALTFSKDSLESEKVTKSSAITSQGKLGTFYYVAQKLNIPLDTIVTWFILVIVLVFDPMSIALFLAYNTIVYNEKKNKISVTIDPPNESNIEELIPEEPIIEEDNIPYYRKAGFDWKPGGQWEQDPSAISWKKEVG